MIHLPELEDGDYKVWLEGVGKEGSETSQLLRRALYIKKYEWQGNNLGKSNIIIPPFTPLRTSGKTVECILRKHELGTLSLWEQVESLKKPILKAPITVKVIAGGKPLAWRASEMQIVEAKPHQVRAEASCENELIKAASVAEFDYDGLMMVSLTFMPKGQPELDRLHLDIPIRKEIATLFYACGEGLRSNPGGAIPPGTDVVWNSRSILQSSIKNFIPYIWVGGEERGICWVADWDKDWVHSKEHSAVELIRQSDGSIVIRVNFLNGPLTLDHSRMFTFGLQASPVKPMPEHWRRDIFAFETPGTARYRILWPSEWGSYYTYAGRYPMDRDYEIVRKLAETKRTGTIDYNFIEDWMAKLKNSDLEWYKTGKIQNNLPLARTHLISGFKAAQSQHGRENTKLLIYSNACDSVSQLPESRVFKDEWEYSQPLMHSSESFRDYAIWYAGLAIDNGIDGIYVDCSYPVAKYTWPIGEAYIGEDSDVHPGLGVISRLRALIWRLAVMMHEKGLEPFVRVHMTNTNILPMLSFVQANLGWEWKFGGDDFQNRFHPIMSGQSISAGRLGQFRTWWEG